MTTTPPPEEKTFAARHATLNYLDCGPRSAAPLVMLHGGAWRWQEYLSLIPTLAERWHVLALDLRGNGRSGWVPDTYRLRDFADDNADFLAHLDAPAVLVGHSLGAVTCLLLAARHPARVRALVLEEPVLTLDNYRRVIDGSRDLFDLWLRLKKSARSEQDLALALADAHKAYPDVTSFWILFFARCLWQLDPTFFDALLHHFDDFAAGYDYREALSAATAADRPVLYLYGDPGRGSVVPEDELAWLRRDCPAVTLAPIPGVGHLLHLEPPGQAPVLAAIRSFLQPL